MKLVFATNNAHKLEEVRQILGDRFEVLSLNDINCHEDIPETGDTFQDNALQKARYVKEHYGYDCFADDTGLEVKALGGAPGVHSARYAGDHDSEANMTKLLGELEKKSDRSAQFRTVVALILNGQEVLFEGIVTGQIATERHYGDGGFGYDPIFVPDSYTETFSQMSPECKNLISHRGRAVRKLADYLKTL
jgi:XTP/dITP diphosphohydrolase